MRNRPIVPGLENYECDIKSQMNRILNTTKDVLSPDWSYNDLEKVLRSLKPGQSQDTMQIANELFMINNIGENLKLSI